MVNFLCVVTLYKCSLAGSQTYHTILKGWQGRIFVYDNSPESQVIDIDNVYYVHDNHNSGLSVAYNTAARYAKENGFEWLLLLDQDTDFSEVNMDDYRNAILSNPGIMLFAPKVKCRGKYMSPARFHHKFAVLQSYVPSGIISLDKYSPINSGLCVNVDAMIECGGYKDDVFLDYSDYQFIDRLRRICSSAYILDCEATQDFSVYSDNRESALKRYELFCKSIKACERHSISDSFWFLFVVVKRGLSVCCRYKTLLPLKLLGNSYLC